MVKRLARILATITLKRRRKIRVRATPKRSSIEKLISALGEFESFPEREQPAKQ